MRIICANVRQSHVEALPKFRSALTLRTLTLSVTMPRSSKVKTTQGAPTTRSTTRANAKWGINAQKSVSLLPVEISINIFFLVYTAWEEVRAKDEDGSVKLTKNEMMLLDGGWIGVSHVCRRWRAVALEYPTLWSFIKLRPGKCQWPMEMLKRSKGRKIKISIDCRPVVESKGIVFSWIPTHALKMAQNHFWRLL